VRKLSYVTKEVADGDFINSNKDRIFEYLGIDKNYSFKIFIEQGHHLMIYFFILTPYEYSISLLQKGSIFCGKDELGKDIYIPIQDFAHLLVGGESGSGKSNTVNMLIGSLFFNIHYKDLISKIYLVDFKYGIEFQPYDNLDDKIQVVSTMEDLNNILDNLLLTMNERASELKRLGKKKQENEAIFLITQLSHIKPSSFCA
jgi:DNA segregation ATPase FtsK/SpoIIIE-like protein